MRSSHRLLPLALFLGCHGSPAHPEPVAGKPTLLVEQSGTHKRLQAVSVVDENVAWASGAGGVYTRTIDGGFTWVAGIVPGADSLEFRDVHAIDDKVAWLLSAGPGGQSRIYKTMDGGRRWLLQFTNPDSSAFYDCFAFWDTKRGIAVSDAVDGQILIIITSNGGATWARVSPERIPPAVNGEGAFAASGTCVVTLGDRLAWIGTGAGERARVFQTEDGGNNWSVVETPIMQGTSTTGIASVSFRDRLNGIAAGGDVAGRDSTGPNVVRTIDGGKSWSVAPSPSFPGPVYGIFQVPRAMIIVAVGPRGAAYSLDDAQRWSVLDTLGYWSAGFASPKAGWLVGPAGRITKVTF